MSMVKAIDIYLQKVQKGEEIEPVELVTDARKEEFIRSQQHKLAKKSRARRSRRRCSIRSSVRRSSRPASARFRR